MKNVVFARTRWPYDSYIDFWRLVEAAAFPIVHVDEIDITDDTKTYIFTPINGEVMPKLPEWIDRKCKIVWWNLERPSDETFETSMSAVARSVDQVWVSDRTYAAKDSRLTYVMVAGHRNFGARFVDRQYHVAHLAYLWGRRKEIVDAMRENGLSIAPEAWGRDQQDRTVGKSHLMVNMHQYDGMNIVAPIRFAVAASYAIPILSEDFSDEKSHPLVIARAPIWQLPNLARDLVQDPDRLRVAGAQLHERLCHNTDFELEVRIAAERM